MSWWTNFSSKHLISIRIFLVENLVTSSQRHFRLALAQATRTRGTMWSQFFFTTSSSSNRGGSDGGWGGIHSNAAIFVFSFCTTLKLYSRGDSPRDDRYAIVSVAFWFLMFILLHNFVVDRSGWFRRRIKAWRFNVSMLFVCANKIITHSCIEWKKWHRSCFFHFPDTT